MIAFLQELGRALAAGDEAFLKAHVALPLTYQYSIYDMEAKIEQRTVRTPPELLKHKDEIAPTAEFLKQLATRGAAARTGDNRCETSPDEINWSQGDRALTVTGDTAKVSFAAESCGATAHHRHYTLRRTPTGWRLVGVDAG